MIRVGTKTGAIVVLSSFDLRLCVVEILRELQVTIPRIELSLQGGTYIQVKDLDLRSDALARLNASEETAH